MHLALLGHAERGGRLVHDDQPRVPENRAPDRHRLTLAAGERRHRRVEPRDVEIERRHRLARRLGHLACGRAPARSRTASSSARGRGKCWRRSTDCRRARGPDRSSRCRCRAPPAASRIDTALVEQDLALVVAEHAGDRLDEGRLAGAVVAGERDDLARIDVERDAVPAPARRRTISKASRTARMAAGSLIGAASGSGAASDRRARR